MDTFIVRDFRESIDTFVNDTELDKLTIVTKHGKPVFVTVPFSKEIVKSGVMFVLAARFFQDGIMSIGRAALFAGCSTSEFIDYLGKAGIPSVHYSAEELEQELYVID